MFKFKTIPSDGNDQSFAVIIIRKPKISLKKTKTVGSVRIVMWRRGIANVIMLNTCKALFLEIVIVIKENLLTAKHENHTIRLSLSLSRKRDE